MMKMKEILKLIQTKSLKTTVSVILFSLLSIPLITKAQQATPKYKASKVIKIPGDAGYDYLSIDQEAQRLYVSHGTMVHVIDLNTEKVIGTIEGMGGVHGIAIVPELKRGFISDGKGNAVIAFDLNTFKIIKKIPLNAKGPDAIIYDSFSKRIFSFNGDSNNSSVIDPEQLSQVGTVDLGGAPEFAVSNQKGLIYNNLEDKNSLNVIDTKSMKVTNNFPLSPCGGPTGIALDDANQRLFSVCRQNKGMSVIDATNGKVITTLPIGAGVDAVVYDADQKLIFVSNGDGTTMIFSQKDADHYGLVQTLTTAIRAKTLALNYKTHKLYLSVADFEKGTRKPLPGTFRVLVYEPVN